MSDDEMSGSDVAKHFGLPTTGDAQAGPNDIYIINGRVKNKARQMSKGVLTPVGDILCNSYSHILKKLYAFSETLPEADKIRLKNILEKAEEMPGDVISASKTGVRP